MRIIQCIILCMVVVGVAAAQDQADSSATADSLLALQLAAQMQPPGRSSCRIADREKGNISATHGWFYHEKEDAKVHCEFCNREYIIGAQEVEQIFLKTITARG